MENSDADLSGEETNRPIKTDFWAKLSCWSGGVALLSAILGIGCIFMCLKYDYLGNYLIIIILITSLIVVFSALTAISTGIVGLVRINRNNRLGGKVYAFRGIVMGVLTLIPEVLAVWFAATFRIPFL